MCVCVCVCVFFFFFLLCLYRPACERCVRFFFFLFVVSSQETERPDLVMQKMPRHRSKRPGGVCLHLQNHSAQGGVLLAYNYGSSTSLKHYKQASTRGRGNTARKKKEGHEMETASMNTITMYHTITTLRVLRVHRHIRTDTDPRNQREQQCNH